MFDEEISTLASMLVKEFHEAGLQVTTAESCTGGLIGGAITSIAGSSNVYARGFVTYANEAKSELLGVSEETLEEHGAVSAACATEMATGARHAAGADVAISVTGIAGPGGGSDEKPIGTVFIAIATGEDDGAFVEQFEFGDIGRDQVRRETIVQALEMALGYGVEEPELN
ncbi:MAG: CinA family protein [Pseudomonadota bacterium]